MVVFLKEDTAKRECLRVISLYYKRIYEMRIDHDRTQRAIAELLGMDLQVYRRYEKGTRDIPLWALIRLADHYETSTDYLLERTDDPSPPHA